jgi:hypothetical protein
MRNRLRADVNQGNNFMSMADSFVSSGTAEPIFAANATSPIISMGSGKAMAQSYSASALMGGGK